MIVISYFIHLSKRQIVIFLQKQFELVVVDRFEEDSLHARLVTLEQGRLIPEGSHCSHSH